jgi:hypothetical protein
MAVLLAEQNVPECDLPKHYSRSKHMLCIAGSAYTQINLV